jgi:hypothetical protein
LFNGYLQQKCNNSSLTPPELIVNLRIAGYEFRLACLIYLLFSDIKSGLQKWDCNAGQA